jgi:hypothetical protein
VTPRPSLFTFPFAVLNKGLRSEFEEVKVEVVECPDLTQQPFTLAKKGKVTALPPLILTRSSRYQRQHQADGDWGSPVLATPRQKRQSLRFEKTSDDDRRRSGFHNRCRRRTPPLRRRQLRSNQIFVQRNNDFQIFLGDHKSEYR